MQHLGLKVQGLELIRVQGVDLGRFSLVKVMAVCICGVQILAGNPMSVGWPYWNELMENCVTFTFTSLVYIYICIYLYTAVIQNVRTIVVLSAVSPDRHCPSRESDKRSNSQ